MTKRVPHAKPLPQISAQISLTKTRLSGLEKPGKRRGFMGMGFLGQDKATWLWPSLAYASLRRPWVSMLPCAKSPRAWVSLIYFVCGSLAKGWDFASLRSAVAPTNGECVCLRHRKAKPAPPCRPGVLNLTSNVLIWIIGRVHDSGTRLQYIVDATWKLSVCFDWR
ncbi:hypothetical protein F5Y01DRAFT_138170 [Xylaria sp. FL0043]|nr:hypothetical protein F5Y01DRAFT_138170 [Xylaria sp. FL0043]